MGGGHICRRRAPHQHGGHRVCGRRVCSCPASPPALRPTSAFPGPAPQCHLFPSFQGLPRPPGAPLKDVRSSPCPGVHSRALPTDCRGAPTAPQPKSSTSASPCPPPGHRPTTGVQEGRTLVGRLPATHGSMGCRGARAPAPLPADCADQPWYRSPLGLGLCRPPSAWDQLSELEGPLRPSCL